MLLPGGGSVCVIVDAIPADLFVNNAREHNTSRVHPHVGVMVWATEVSTGIERVCSSTGLWLVRSSGQVVVRLAKPSYGPLNPPQRELHGGDRAEWGRFDVAGHRSIYAASTPEGAYAESLAALRPAALGSLADMFDNDDDPRGDGSLLTAVAAEWGYQHNFKPARIPRGWRDERREYPIVLPADGWFVDIEHSSSLAAVGGAFPHLDRHLDVAHLRGPDRQLTTSIAGWLHAQVLDDGSLLHGVRYGSRHGSEWTNWSVWLRVVDDGDDPARDVLKEPTRAWSGRPIGDEEHNPALRSVCDRFQLHCY